MNILVQKFGGTSVSSKENRTKVIGKIKNAIKSGYAPVVVVSAMGRKGLPYATDTLLSLLNKEFSESNCAATDLLLSCGEVISTVVLSSDLHEEGIDAVPLTGGQAGIVTDSNYTNAKTLKTDVSKIIDILNSNKVPVVAGFQGIDENGFITTIGRGGSDTTACILGAALNADAIEIYTDVDGVMTADPNIVKNVHTLDDVDYYDIVQFAEQGAKVIHPHAVEIAMKANIPLIVKNTFSNAKGTTIRNCGFGNNDNCIITGITSTSNRVQIKTNLNSADLNVMLKSLSKHNVSIDLINIFLDNQVFTISEKDYKCFVNIMNSLNYNYDSLHDCCKVAVIGAGMHNLPGVMSLINKTLLEEDIKILQTADSNNTIWCLIEEVNKAKAIEVLHRVFVEYDK